MRILAIETSCDETGIAILEANGDIRECSAVILGNALLSQADKHAKYGGVYPSLAKREHSKNLVPLTELALQQAGMLIKCSESGLGQRDKLEKLLEREPELHAKLIVFLDTYEKPPIDAIAVTEGPGLEPALWVGINFAKALSIVWKLPVIPINHMEGHIVASLLSEEIRLGHVEFPALALLISGGHTELVLIEDWLKYELLGSTRDDALGEAFDKVARMLGLSYPGGPEISRLANEARIKNIKSKYSLPRPMINSDDCDFSFSGLKTAVLYSLRDIDNITPEIKREFALEFEDAVVEILIKKTKRAIDLQGVKTLILGGGVSANISIRKAFTDLFNKEYPSSLLYIPEAKLATDNAVMIALAALLRHDKKNKPVEEIRAQGKLKLS